MMASLDYLDSVARIAGIPDADGYVEMRNRSLENLIDYGNDFLQHARALTDAYQIAMNQWQRDSAWSPETFRDIAQAVSRDSSDCTPHTAIRVASDVWHKLCKQIEEQNKTFPRSFDEFQSRSEFAAPRDDIDAYREWFERYLPVVTLDLEPGTEDAWKTAHGRMWWMLEQGPDGVDFETMLEADALRHLLLWWGDRG